MCKKIKFCLLVLNKVLKNCFPASIKIDRYIIIQSIGVLICNAAQNTAQCQPKFRSVGLIANLIRQLILFTENVNVHVRTYIAVFS